MSKETKVVPIFDPIIIERPFFKDKTFPEIKLIVKIVITELDCVNKQTIIPVIKEDITEPVNLFKTFRILSWLFSSIVFPRFVILYNNKQTKDKIIKKDEIFIINYMFIK